MAAVKSPRSISRPIKMTLEHIIAAMRRLNLLIEIDHNIEDHHLIESMKCSVFVKTVLSCPKSS